MKIILVKRKNYYNIILNITKKINKWVVPVTMIFKTQEKI